MIFLYYKKMKKVKKNILKILLILMVVVIISMSYLAYIVFWPLQTTGKDVIITVRWGASFTEVAQKCRENQVVKSADDFRLTAKIFNKTLALKAGRFTLKQGMSNYEALKGLTEGRQSFIQVTIPEGLTAQKIAGIVAKKMDVDSAIFLSLVNDSAFIAGQNIDSPSLQGYLYPETYFFTFGLGEKQIIQTLLDMFHKQYSDSLQQQAKRINFTDIQVLTLASIIEGEAMIDSEMAAISSVYHNRLRKGMLLQADPTIQFIIPNGPRRLLFRDLEIDSPYNTYKYPGLPPGPISNPGIKAIRAALFPDETPYLYFVANGDGSHTFSTSLNQHLRAKREFDKYRRKIKQKQRLEKLSSGQ